ncbi:MAG TPA: TIGR03089 family protein [Propionibacteriaceae bacterium]|nr:TIGR03089 family protein [Propionibacteriaceae bacterium]
MAAPSDPASALELRVRTSGAQPFLTWYEPATGARVEFSAITFANWVDKTANLLGSLGFDDEPSVGIPLLVTDPCHWVGLVWTMATWQIGGRVVCLPRGALDSVDVAVVGPREAHPVPGSETVACSLHPLGLGFATPPAGVTDYREVLAEPDVHWSSDPATAGFTDADRTRDWASICATRPSSERGLVIPGTDTWTWIAEALVAPLLGGGSTVLVSGPVTDSGLDRIRADERVG